MTLEQWLTANGAGAAHRLHLSAGVSLPVIGRARAGRANLASATKIHVATGGRVSISSMTADDVPERLETPTRERKRARR
jgi:hypothetical protein